MLGLDALKLHQRCGFRASVARAALRRCKGSLLYSFAHASRLHRRTGGLSSRDALQSCTALACSQSSMSNGAHPKLSCAPPPLAIQPVHDSERQTVCMYSLPGDLVPSDSPDRPQLLVLLRSASAGKRKRRAVPREPSASLVDSSDLPGPPLVQAFTVGSPLGSLHMPCCSAKLLLLGCNATAS